MKSKRYRPAGITCVATSTMLPDDGPLHVKLKAPLYPDPDTYPYPICPDVAGGPASGASPVMVKIGRHAGSRSTFSTSEKLMLFESQGNGEDCQADNDGVAAITYIGQVLSPD